MLKRDSHNPILSPKAQNDWESFAVFNGSIIKKRDEYVLVYRAMGKEKRSTIGKARSTNGIDFFGRQQFIKPEYAWEKYGCEDPRVTKIDDAYYIFYTALSDYPHTYQGIRVALAISKDLHTIDSKHLITPFNAKAMSLFPEKINGLYTVLLTVNTDNLPSYTAIAQCAHIESLWDTSFWKQWYDNIDQHKIDLKRINCDHVEFGAQPLKLAQGWLIIYSYIKHYLSHNVQKEFRIEGVLLDLEHPQKIIGRIDKPLLKPEEQYEKTGQIANIVFPEGALIEDNQLKVYYGAADSYCAMASIDMTSLLHTIEVNAPAVLKCKKFPNNPLLSPVPEHEWENFGVFNPAAIAINGTTYLMYRAVSKDNVSNFGLAISNDGLYIDERLSKPIYPLRKDFEKPNGKNESYGAEDARLTIIDATIYLCYTAYDGRIPRLAFSSISIDDFLKRQWHNWAEPKIISPPHIADKDGALFPEKINDSYVFFHRIDPNIIIARIPNLAFAHNEYLNIQGVIAPRPGYWDAVKVGINTPPIKTERGWLVLYHGISEIDHHYRTGAMLLDINDPTKVVGRTLYPILEAEALFEREGVVNNVTFPCGLVENGDTIYIYYGGADRVVCGAKINITTLLDYIQNSSIKKYLV